MTKISILGCGWLGFPLAKALIAKGFTVKGSTTSPDKLELLKDASIDGFQIALGANQIEGNIADFLSESAILIIDIPPKLRNPENESFVEKIKLLLPFIENSTVKKVVFVSSTSVFADGFPIQIVTENDTPNPDSESGKQLLITEKLLLGNPNLETTVLRFAGLIGENRHPIRSLSGRKDIDNPDAPINLIHQNDCIGIILKVIETDSWNEIYNAVAPFHPSRKEYYEQQAINFNLAFPEFNETTTSIGKNISSEKLIGELGYEFLVEL